MSPIVSGSSGGGSGIGAVLFDSTLGADTANIDTLANGIAQTQNVLEVWVIVRTDDAAAVGSVLITLNNDSGANYDNELLNATNAAVTAGPTLAAAAWSIAAHGAGGTAGYPTILRLTLPGYTQTTFSKVAELVGFTPDTTAANVTLRPQGLGYRPTTAISRMKVAVGGAGTVLKAGSRLLVLGR